MVGCRMLTLIDMRLRQAFSEHSNEPFGGRSIILFGDFGQLPPVFDLPMYDRAHCQMMGLQLTGNFGKRISSR
jgi:hypothetical protein